MPAKGETTPILDRLRRRSVIDPDGCWLWRGYTQPANDGRRYGRIWDPDGAYRRSGRPGMAGPHRVAYLIFVGHIPPDRRCEAHLSER
jgi:hypothetical protein